jgi:hypothetical protein
MAVETVCRYMRCQSVLLEVLEDLPSDAFGVGGTLAIAAGIGQLLSERALTAYNLVREARGLARLTYPLPDASLLAELAAKIEGPGGGDPGDLG